MVMTKMNWDENQALDKLAELSIKTGVALQPGQDLLITAPMEAAPLVNLAEQGDLMAFKHRGYWKPMDTLREKRELEADWQCKDAPWVSRKN